MASITTWMRLEPHSRARDMEASLEMRIHDPLWMLARQWHFGEFQGEDTGSPVWAVVNGEEMPISLFLPGPIDGHGRDDVQEYSPNLPLEFLVERERIPAYEVLAANRRLAVEAGQHFLRLLGSTLSNKYRASLLLTHGIEPLTEDERQEVDPDSLVFFDLMAGRALDGALLLAAIQQGSPVNGATNLGFDTDDEQAATWTITSWLDWCEQMVGPVSLTGVIRQAWNPERMEYSCALSAPLESNADQVILKAVEYPGGHLDWYSFDAVLGQKLNRDITAKSAPFSSATIPTGLSFRGMPASRLWEFEDAQVRFGSIQAAPTDLARMLLVEFLIEYGNDFFTIPIEIDAGSLFRIEKNGLTVTNTFGDITTPSPFADQAWRLFALSTEKDSDANKLSSVLFVPPVINQSINSPPIEEVHLLRDEMANIAWAVEHIVESKCGRPLNRHEAFQARRQREEGDKQPVGTGTLVYRLDTWQSSLPDYWIPLLPEQITPGQSPLRLKCFDSHGNSKGRLLSEHAQGSRLYLFDEEVPRMGVQIKRVHQYARWYDGNTLKWIGREKRPGRGEGSSGLRFDVVETLAD